MRHIAASLLSRERCVDPAAQILKANRYFTAIGTDT
jgi:hypothetical protein